MRDKDESSSQNTGREESSEQGDPSLTSRTGRAETEYLPETGLDVNINEENEVLAGDDHGIRMDIDE